MHPPVYREQLNVRALSKRTLWARILIGFTLGLLLKTGTWAASVPGEAAFRQGLEIFNLSTTLVDESQRKAWTRAVTLFESAAGQGHLEAMMILGSTLAGTGQSNDIRQAVSWYQKAFDGGRSDAVAEIGYLVWNLDFRAPELEEALAWWRKGAERNSTECMYLLGLTLTHAANLNRDTAAGNRWLRAAALQKHDRAATLLAIRGDLSAAELEQLISRIYMAGGDNRPLSQFLLAHGFESGKGVKKDPDLALRLYGAFYYQPKLPFLNRAEELIPEYDSYVRLALQKVLELYATSDFPKGRPDGPFFEHVKPGRMFPYRPRLPETLPVNFPSTIRSQWVALRTQGYGNVPADPNVEVSSDADMALQGDLDAIFRMGNRWLKGFEANPDPEEARRWFMRAALRGHIPSQMALGQLLLQNGATNRLDAVFWLARANPTGEMGRVFTQELGNLTPAEREELQRRDATLLKNIAR